MLHMGTLVALLIYFRRDLVRLLGAWLASIRDRRIGDDPDRRIAWLLVISIIPAALLGAALESFFDTTFRQTIGWIGVFILVGAALLWLAERWGTRTRGLDQMTRRDAGVIGVAQALALFPGISRSGITIAAGLFLGLEREAAARFSFLMAVPVIAGAGLWKARTLVGAGLEGAQVDQLVVGILTSAIFGFLAIWVLLRYLRQHGTGIFVAYRIVLAAAVFVFLLSRWTAMEVMKQLRQRAIRDLVEQRAIRTQQELAAALRERGFRTTQATISRDVAELGLIKVSRDGTQAYALPPRLIEAEASGEDRLRKLLATCRSRSTRPACSWSCARCPARPTRSPPRWTARAGRRSPAPSPVTTRCSSRSPTGARSSASVGGSFASRSSRIRASRLTLSGVAARICPGRCRPRRIP